MHEECLTGLAAWQAATYPTPLAWGASFDPELVHEVARAIGDSMRQLGIHQGLAPVLDVVRDPRWGRVDECIGEDPYLVGTVGTAFVRGLQEAGVHATLKHFVGYSGSRSGRNHAPVSAGPREIADVFLPPFEMAVLDGGARSVMNAYNDIDGVPVASSTDLLTGVLRERWGFDGVVVADYFAVAFLQVMHACRRRPGQAAALALVAGIDVELPTGDAYLQPLADQVRAGAVDEAFVDRAVLRALAQKEELGLLDPDGLRGRAAHRHRPGPATSPGARPPARGGVGRPAVEQRRAAAERVGAAPDPRRRHRAERRPCAGAHGLLLVRQPRAGPPSRAAARLRGPDGRRGPRRRRSTGPAWPVRSWCVAEGCAVEGEDTSGFAEAP